MKIFCIILLSFLGCFTNKVSGQFVPFESGEFKLLAADTLYNLTGCGTPTTTPGYYKKVVDYYDSCGHTKYYWQPENNVWVKDSLANSGAGVQSVTGTLVDNTDPINPIVRTPSLEEAVSVFGTSQLGFGYQSPIYPYSTVGLNGGDISGVVIIGSNYGPTPGSGVTSIGSIATHSNELYFPNRPSLESRIIPISVAGKFADSTGNIPLDSLTIVLGSTTWNLTGNSGTDTAANFLGTTDSIDLVFKTNNILRGGFGVDGGLYLTDIPLAFNNDSSLYVHNGFIHRGLHTLQKGYNNSLTYEDDPTINVHGNNFTIDSTLGFSVSSYLDGGYFHLDGSPNTSVFRNTNDTLYAGIRNTIYPFGDPDSSNVTISSHRDTQDSLQYKQQIIVSPKYIELKGVYGQYEKSKVIFRHLDTLLTAPDYIMAFSGDTVVKASYTAAAAGGIGAVYAGTGLTKDNDSTLSLNTTYTDGRYLKLSDSAAMLSPYIRSANYIVREIPAGSIDGSNADFTLAFTPVVGKEMVFQNGLLQEPGSGNDYTIVGAVITFLTAPPTDTKISVTYLK